MRKDYYQLLEIKPGCSIDEVKTSFRRLAKQRHPDVAGDEAARRRAEEAFKLLNEAYGELSDPIRKAAYDRLLSDLGLLRPNVGGSAREAGWETSPSSSSPQAPRNEPGGGADSIPPSGNYSRPFSQPNGSDWSAYQFYPTTTSRPNTAAYFAVACGLAIISWAVYRAETAPPVTPTDVHVEQDSGHVYALGAFGTYHLVQRQILLVWSPVDNATSYNIYRGEYPGAERISPYAAGRQSDFQDSNVENGTDYYYVVRSVNQFGVSGPSNEVAATR